jgi:lipopolysaccharide export system permease protein
LLKKIRIVGFLTFDRYLFTTFFKNFITSLFFFVAIYLFSTALTELPSLLKRAEHNPAITFTNVALNYYYKIPNFFSTVFPFAYLFSTSFVLGNFYKNNEIISAISAGWTMRRITFSLVFFGLLCSLFMMYLNFKWIPDANYEASQMEAKLYKEVKVRDVDNIQTYGGDGILYFARYYNSRNQLFISFMMLKEKGPKKLVVEDVDIPNINALSSLSIEEQIEKLSNQSFSGAGYFPYEWAMRAKKMFWDEKKGRWIAQEGYQWWWDEKGKVVNLESFQEKVMELQEKPSYFSKETRDIQEMSLDEVQSYIEKLKKSKQPYKKELIEYYSQKYAKPFSIFILAILASALGRFFSRKHLLVMTLVFSFVIGAFYFVIINVGISLGKEGMLPPLLAAFLGNFISIGIYFYLKKKQLT